MRPVSNFLIMQLSNSRVYYNRQNRNSSDEAAGILILTFSRERFIFKDSLCQNAGP